MVSFSQVIGPDEVLVAKANCGVPAWVDGGIRYNGTPEMMACYTKLARDAGARVIGGCCGTTPKHLRAMRAALDDYVPGPPPDLTQITELLGDVSAGARNLGDNPRPALAPRAAQRAGRRSRRRSSE